MFLAFFLGWSLVGLAVAVSIFIWAIRSRQFESSRRAALLPFDDVAPEAPSGTRQGKLNFVILVLIIGTGITLTAVMLALALIYS